MPNCEEVWYAALTAMKRKDSAGSDNAASMIKGGGYVGARIRQLPPTAQTKKINVGQGGCVP